jgi:hypothetical protein
VPDALARQFRDELGSILNESRIPHQWSTSGDFVHLEIAATDGGFKIHANVSKDYSGVILNRSLDRAWFGNSKHGFKIEDVIDFVELVLSPQVRLREQNRGNRTCRWILEQDFGGKWYQVVSRRSWNPLSYFGHRSETVRQNRHLSVAV